MLHYIMIEFDTIYMSLVSDENTYHPEYVPVFWEQPFVLNLILN